MNICDHLAIALLFLSVGYHLGRWRAYMHAEEIARKTADDCVQGDGENDYEHGRYEGATWIAGQIARAWLLRRLIP